MRFLQYTYNQSCITPSIKYRSKQFFITRQAILTMQDIEKEHQMVWKRQNIGYEKFSS